MLCHYHNIKNKVVSPINVLLNKIFSLTKHKKQYTEYYNTSIDIFILNIQYLIEFKNVVSVSYLSGGQVKWAKCVLLEIKLINDHMCVLAIDSKKNIRIFRISNIKYIHCSHKQTKYSFLI